MIRTLGQQDPKSSALHVARTHFALNEDDQVKTNGTLKQPQTTFFAEFLMAFKEGPRICIAPLVGAFRAIRDELNRARDAHKQSN